MAGELSIDDKRRAVLELRLRQRQAAPGEPRPSAGSGSTVLPLRPTGRRLPLFLVHAAAGSALPYEPLARLLDEDQPVHGLEAPGLVDGEPIDDMTELARRHVAAMREVRPRGPYLLGGWSIGGGVAWEMAVQLRDAGEEVALIALLDTVMPGPGQGERDHVALLGWFCHDLTSIAGVECPPLDVAWLELLPEPEREAQVVAMLRRAGAIAPGMEEQISRRIGVFVASGRAHWGHRPRPYAGPAVLLRAAGSRPDDAGGWRDDAPGLEVVTVPGTHYTLLREPDVRAVADELSRRIAALPRAGEAARRVTS
ncbi:MAG: thioesterase domain-containing protein [Frankiaceae bacterium]